MLTNSHKIDLSARVGVITRALYLSPSTESGFNTCQFATLACAAACLGHSSGKMNFPTSKTARIRKTTQLFRDRPGFFADLRRDIAANVRKAEREGLAPAIRLNGSSDIPWERFTTDRAASILEEFPEVSFYDYTKNPARAMDSKTSPAWPANYHLTLSRSGENDSDCLAYLAAGGNVAAVFTRPEDFPATYWNYPVTSGEIHDYRAIDPPGHVIALKARGKATSDYSGFVIRPCANCGAELRRNDYGDLVHHIHGGNACRIEARATAQDALDTARNDEQRNAYKFETD